MPTDSQATYENFLRQVEPFSLGLKSCSAALDRDVYWDLQQKKSKRHERRQINARYELKGLGRGFIDAQASLKLLVLDASAGGAAARNDILRIECVFETHFHAPRPIHEEYARRFVDADLKIVVWPYFRQFVWDTTARMFIPPLLIPLSIGGGELNASSGESRERRKGPPKRPGHGRYSKALKSP